MKWLLIYIAFLIYIKAEESGIRFSIEEEIITQYQKRYLPQFIAKIGQMKIPNQFLQSKNMLFTIDVLIKDIMFDISNVKEEDLSIELASPNQIIVRGKNMKGHGSFEADYKAIFEEQDKVKITVNDFSFKIIFTLSSKQSNKKDKRILPYALLTDFDYDIDMDFTIQGSYIGSVINLLKGLIKEKLLSSIKPILQSQIQKESLKIIDEICNKLSPFYPVQRTPYAVDLSLLSAPYVEDGKLFVYTRGVLVSNNKTKEEISYLGPLEIDIRRPKEFRSNKSNKMKP
jgi:hypothetical protein